MVSKYDDWARPQCLIQVPHSFCGRYDLQQQENDGTSEPS